MTPMEQSERTGLVDRLRNGFDWHDEASVGQAERDMDAAADMLESDARPAPMAEEVRKALRDLESCQTVGGLTEVDAVLKRADAMLRANAAHIDDLTRKVAEAEAGRDEWKDLAIRRGQPSPEDQKAMDIVREAAAVLKARPQETDAVLAEREGCELDVLRERAKWPQRSEGYIALTRAAERVRSRPSPGPATETERERRLLHMARGYLSAIDDRPGARRLYGRIDDYLEGRPDRTEGLLADAGETK